MQEYQFVVDENSINLIKEFNNYSWSNSKAGIPIDKWNHGIDAVRYSIMYSKQFNQTFDYDFAFL